MKNASNITACPNAIMALYEELLSHDGYGDIHISVRLGQGKKKEVRIHCGKEYRFLVDQQSPGKGRRLFHVVYIDPGKRFAYRGSERRLNCDRRGRTERRRMGEKSRSFRLEQRRGGDRRIGRGRRRDE